MLSGRPAATETAKSDSCERMSTFTFVFTGILQLSGNEMQKQSSVGPSQIKAKKKKRRFVTQVRSCVVLRVHQLQIFQSSCLKVFRIADDHACVQKVSKDENSQHRVKEHTIFNYKAPHRFLANEAQLDLEATLLFMKFDQSVTHSWMCISFSMTRFKSSMSCPLVLFSSN